MSKEVKKSTSLSDEPSVIKHSVGIDMGKESFSVCYQTLDTDQRLKIKGSRQFKNQPAEFFHFYDWCMSRHREGIRLVFTLEATGVYYEALAFFLYDHGLHVSVVLPNRSKSYFKSMGLKSKTDKIDACGLAQMGAEQNLTLWNRPEDWTMKLRQSTRQREQLQATRTVLLNQKEALCHSGLPNEMLKARLDDVLRVVSKHISELSLEIERILTSETERERGVRELCKIKGVGMQTVAVVLSETNCFKDFDSISQLVSYCSYDVVENQSGSHRGATRISKRGNAHIRRALHLPAFSIKTYDEDPVLVSLWDRVYERTKQKMKAYVAVQRKLLVLLYTLWKKGTPYIVGYQKEPCTKAGLT